MLIGSIKFKPKFYFTLALVVALSATSAAKLSCLRAIRMPVLFNDAVNFKKAQPEAYNNVVSHFIENGFFIGPKMLSIFEKQLIEDGTLSYDLEENSFVSSKPQMKANKAALNFLANAQKEQLRPLANELYKALHEGMALGLRGDSSHVEHEIKEHTSLMARPWDQREIVYSEIMANHHALAEAIATPEGEAFIKEILIESIPVYAHMLQKLLIYTNGSVDMASVVTGKLLWSSVLTTATGFLDIFSLSQVAAAAAGALIDTPSVTATRSYFSNKKVRFLQQEIGWTLSAKLKHLTE